MFYPITCRVCGENPCPNEVGRVSATLKLTALRGDCEKCHRRDEYEHTVYFCSVKCLVQFVSEGGIEREEGIAVGTIRPWMGE